MVKKATKIDDISKRSAKKTSQKAEKPVTSTTSSMDELLKKHIVHTPRKGEEVEAKIVSITKKQLVFDIGWKSYAVLGQLESQDLATYLPFLKPGDKVKVKVVVELQPLAVIKG